MVDRDSNILWGIISNYSSAVLIMFGTFVFTPILLRFISPGEYGDFSSILSAYSIIGPLATFGMFNSIRKHLVEADDSEDKERIAAFSFIFVVILAIVVTVVSLIGLGAIRFRGLVSYSMFLGLLLALLAILFDNILEYSRSVLYAESREPLAEGLKVTKKYVHYLVGLLLVYIGGGVIAVLFSFLLGSMVTGSIGLLIVSKNISVEFSTIKKGYEKFGSEIMSFGGWSASSLIIASLMYNADILLVRTMAGSQQAGFYTAALTIAQLFWFFPRGVQSILFHNMADLYSNDEHSKMVKITSKWLDNMFLILTLLGVGIYVLATPFFGVYFGQEYLQSVTSFKILMIGTFMFGIGRVFSPIIETAGWIKHNVLVSAIVLITNIVLNILLIPRYGIEGAALATSISYSLKIIQYIIILNHAGYDIIDGFNWGKNATLLVLFFIILSLLDSFLHLNQFVRLIVIPFMGLSVFLVLCVFMGYIDENKMKSIQTKFQ